MAITESTPADWKERSLAPTQDPIIITGGSILLEYADGGADGFEPDTANPSARPRKKLKHKRNGGGGKAELRWIKIYDRPLNTDTPVERLPPAALTIDLEALGLKRGQIWVIHDYE
jgi:hypothetical protein